MNTEEIYTKLINELKLEKNKRIAVDYSDHVGDFYSLCASVQYAEKKLNKQYIIIYCSDVQQEIIKWFSYDDYTIKAYRMAKEEYEPFHNANLNSLASNEERTQYFVSFAAGDPEFRGLTRNISDCFPVEHLRKPHIETQEDISEKYSSLISPQKTVFIIPDARYVASLPVWFWNQAAQFFKYLGYKVVFNADSQKSNIYNGECVYIPLSEIVGFANECGFVFGVRTGLFDLLSASTAQMIIFSTKRYKPLDEVFHIPNGDNRIRTIFYEDRDPYFKRTEALSFAERYYEEKYKNSIALLTELCKEMTREQKQLSPTPAVILKSYRCETDCNRYLWWDAKSQITPFAKPEYTFTFDNDRINFCIRGLSEKDYMFDYKIYCNNCEISAFSDFRSNCLVYPIKRSGEYYIKATLTDLKNYNQEFFETERLFFTAPVPETLEELRQCTDFYSYILALKKFGAQLAVLISSKDAHTYFEENIDTQQLRVMSLLGLKTDFESTCRYSFICVINSGKIETELLSLDKKLTYRCEIGGKSISIESSGYNVTHSPGINISININSNNEAVNKRGLNIVVIEKRSGNIVDSVCFDTFSKGNASRKS